MKKYPDLKTAHRKTGCPGVKCDLGDSTPIAFNCHLSASQTVKLATYMLFKAQLIREYGEEDTATVHLWYLSKGKRLSVGLRARKRKK